MSPILTRPVREQLEHDRVIRLLQARYTRKTEVIINPGSEQNQSVTIENLVQFPDVLIFAEGGKTLIGTVEVETGESVKGGSACRQPAAARRRRESGTRESGLGSPSWSRILSTTVSASASTVEAPP